MTDIPKYKEAVRTNITTFESKATNLGWNCFDISVAYDPNNYPDYMNIGFYDQNIETINLSGLINLSSSGTVTSTNVSNPVSWLVDLVGEEGGKKVEEIWNTSIRKKDAEETNRIIGGIAQKLITSGLFKIFGSAIMKLNKTEEVNSSIELTTSGNLSFKGQILSVQASPIPSMQKLLMPGVTPKSTDDILPLYNKKIGVWKLKQQPTIYLDKELSGKFYPVPTPSYLGENKTCYVGDYTR